MVKAGPVRRRGGWVSAQHWARSGPPRPLRPSPRLGSGHAGVMCVGRFSSLWGRRARVRWWAGGGRLVWRRGLRPGRRSRSVSRRVLAASCPALQGAPLTQFGVCVSGGDPLGGLAALGMPPAVLSGDRCFAGVFRLAGWSAHLAGELAGKSPVAFAGLGFRRRAAAAAERRAGGAGSRSRRPSTSPQGATASATRRPV